MLTKLRTALGRMRVVPVTTPGHQWRNLRPVVPSGLWSLRTASAGPSIMRDVIRATEKCLSINIPGSSTQHFV